MAHNQGPEQTPDPAGNTQMFRAFVDEEAPRRQGGGVQQPAASSGPRVGVIVGVVVAIIVIAAVVWLAVG